MIPLRLVEALVYERACPACYGLGFVIAGVVCGSILPRPLATVAQAVTAGGLLYLVGLAYWELTVDAG